MAYYDDNLELCHQLTETGKQRYQDLLVEKADEILFKHQHPVKWFLQKVFTKIA